MRHVEFIKEFGDVETSGGWNFKKEYPSMLSNDGDGSEIWISEERLKIPVGKRRVASRFFVWLKFDEFRGNFTCMFGIVPDKGALDEHAVGVLNRRSSKNFSKNPYLHMLSNKSYRHVFLVENDILEETLALVRDAMFLSADYVEDNLVDMLYDRVDGYVKEDGKEDLENGWSVILRACAGSL